MPRPQASFTQSDVTRDTRLCLEAAAHLAFPDGTVNDLIVIESAGAAAGFKRNFEARFASDEALMAGAKQ